MNIVDLFAGCGGFSCGFEQAGFKTKLAIEIDVNAAESFKFNHPEAIVLNEDITKVETISALLKDSIVGVIGSPPCQSFSYSGKRDVNDPRNSLFIDYMRIVRDVRPKFFVMENVKGLLTKRTENKERVLDLIIQEANKSGYNVTYSLLNSAEYGVPQARERLIIVGIRDDIVVEMNSVLPKGLLFEDEQITVEQAIMDLPQINAGEGSECQEYTVDPQNDYQKSIRVNSDKVYNHVAMKHSARLVKRFEQIQFGQSVADVSEEFSQRKRGDSTKISGKAYRQNNFRVYPNRPSPTIPASFQSNFVHPYLNRNFTAREGMRLQSFPDTYIVKGMRTKMSWEVGLSQYQQIGNAVPPLLAKAIAENLKNILNLELNF